MGETDMEIPNTLNGENLEVDEISDIESRIEVTIRSSIDRVKQESKTLTGDDVQIFLEEELGLGANALDAHKMFIQQCISPFMEGNNDKTEVNASGKDNAVELIPDGENQETGSEVILTLDMVKDALQKRASYIRLNSETITLAVLRRLLEDDLKLEKMALDKYKHAIVEEVDNIMKNNEVEKTKTTKTKTKKTKTTKKTPHTESDDSVKESGSTSSDGKSGEYGGEDEEEEFVKPRKRVLQRAQSNAKVKKRSRAKTENEFPKKRQKNSGKPKHEENSELEEDGNGSEKQSPQSSSEKLIKQKAAAVPAYGKRVEHLKSVIKLCGISVAPSVYTKAKRTPEDNREAFLIKELEDILARQGLSSNPSEKEIKSVKRRKERAKELEGIDLGNIVSSSRRRSTTFLPPLPEPKLSSGSDEEGSLDSDDEGNSDSSKEGDGEDGDSGDSGDSGDGDDGGDENEMGDDTNGEESGEGDEGGSD